jgi:hypothetical protein
MARVTIMRVLPSEDMPKIMIVQAKHSPAVSQQAVYCHHQYEAKSCAFLKHIQIRRNTDESYSMSIGILVK